MEYRNKLCGLIGEKVGWVDEYLDIGLVFEFKNQVIISTPLKVDRSYPCGEIAEFHGWDNIWNVWQVGERPFE